MCASLLVSDLRRSRANLQILSLVDWPAFSPDMGATSVQNIPDGAGAGAAVGTLLMSEPSGKHDQKYSFTRWQLKSSGQHK